MNMHNYNSSKARFIRLHDPFSGNLQNSPRNGKQKAPNLTPLDMPFIMHSYPKWDQPEGTLPLPFG